MTASAFAKKRVANEGCPFLGSKKKGGACLHVVDTDTQTHHTVHKNQGKCV